MKLLTDYANVPAGTWATVDSSDFAWNGAWYFTVRWGPYTRIPHKFPRGAVVYSVNLWEADLALFEVVTTEQETARTESMRESALIRTPQPKLGGGWQPQRRSKVHPNQLRLFVADDF